MIPKCNFWKKAKAAALVRKDEKDKEKVGYKSNQQLSKLQKESKEYLYRIAAAVEWNGEKQNETSFCAHFRRHKRSNKRFDTFFYTIYRY